MAELPNDGTPLTWNDCLGLVKGSAELALGEGRSKARPERGDKHQMKPTVGRIVHYQTEDGNTLPAMIVKVHSDTCVNLQAFSKTATESSRHGGPA